MRAIMMVCLCLLTGIAQAANREVIPIHSVTMADGELRYSVSLKIGGTVVETMLDTGSVGLRVFPGVLKPQDSVAQNTPAWIEYGTGVRLYGTLVLAKVSLGNVEAQVPVQRVDSIGCTDTRPKCAAFKVPSRDFLMGGNPLLGEGFKAIIGVGMLRSSATNPLVAMGGRWLVLLPRPGQSEGQLILNPTTSETQGFRDISLQRVPTKPGDPSAYWNDHGLQSCLKRLDNNQQICGNSLLDSGGAHFYIYAYARQASWPMGTPVHFRLLMADGSQLGQRFRVDNHGGRTVSYLIRGEHHCHVINAGLLTYFDYAVLYDQTAGTIGFRRR